jgi:protein arginine kinase activator
MYCERCKRNQATIHLTEILKNVKSEVHLCDICASDIGLNAKISKLSISPENLKEYCENSEDRAEYGIFCDNCGFTLDRVLKSSALGCSNCLAMDNQILEIITNRHNNFSGKIPASYISVNLKRNKIVKHKRNNQNNKLVVLQKKLEEAVLDERYEEAAILRDKIRDKEKTKILKE